MKIAVCIKHVPVVSRIQFDYETKTIVREGVPSEVNSYDLLGVDKAVELVQEHGGEAVVFTMGPPAARDSLIQCRAMGANRSVHISDRALAGSDTLATARCLALALQREAFDLVICGRHSTDAETGQVGPETAELMGIPHVSNVRKLDYSPAENTITVERETDEGHQVISCPLPALVTVTEGIMPERFPRREAMQAAQDDPAIEDVTASQLSDDLDIFGSNGSPTWVSEIRLMEPQRLGIVFDEEPADAAAKIAEALKGRGEPASSPEERGRHTRYAGSDDKPIWVVVERSGQGIRRASLEVLGKARDVAEQTQSEVVAVMLDAVSEEEVRHLAAYGADRVLSTGPINGHPAGLSAINTLASGIAERKPYAVLFNSTPDGRDLSSRVAARLGLGLTGDAVDLEVDADERLVQLKPALGGNVIAPILSKTLPYMATMRPGLMTPIEPEEDAAVETEVLTVHEHDGPDITLLHDHVEEDAQGLELESARIVLGVGMGVGDAGNVPTVRALAESIGASLAATRSVADEGWLPRQLQVGLTGRAIAPDLYIAVGVRGDFNHTVGIQRAGTILAINTNPNPRRTPMFNAADYSIVGDWEEALPALIEAIKPFLGDFLK